MSKVWDGFVRGYHWLLVIGITVLWWTADNGYMEWHLRTAIGVGSLLIARVIWAIVGSHNARFSAFVSGPKAVISHFKDLRKGDYQPGTSHNPAGGWAVLTLWAVLFVQLSTGLFATDEIFFSGPLASLVSSATQEQLTDIHKLNFNLLVGLIVVHVIAIIFYWLRGINLLAAMLHGKREVSRAPRLYNSLGVWLLTAFIAASAWYFWG